MPIYRTARLLLQSVSALSRISYHFKGLNKSLDYSDCQINDWKHGDPPHKTVCGKLISDIPTSPKPSIQSAKFPSPRTFRPSLALMRQMSLLNKDPSADYFLIPPAPLPDIGIAMAEPSLTELFRAMRDRAFETCDKEAVGFMFKFLEGAVQGRSGFGLKQLEKQLGAEFGMDGKELREQARLAGEDLRALVHKQRSTSD
jgi:hypothetical protein